MFGMTALTALTGATIAPSDAQVPAELEPAIRMATAGAWRAVEVMYAAELLRGRIGKASEPVRRGIEAVLALVPPASNFDAMTSLRAAREQGAFEGPLDFAMAIGLARMPHDPQPAIVGALAGFPALAAAIDRNVIAMLVEVTRALLHLEPAISMWTYAPTPYEAALAPFVELVRTPGALDELEALITRPIQLDENVQFTVYRPRTIDPGKWHPLIAFAHLAERRPGEEMPDPVEEVQRQAKQVLGERADAYQPVTQDAGAAIPAESELTFVPELPGIEVNPPRRSFLWLEPVHREEFRMKAGPELDGKTVRGRLTVFLGAIAIAEISLSVKVDAARPEPTIKEPSHARTYRKIFASYSHRDLAIVNQFEGYARALGDEYVRDWVHLRTGEVWNDRLLKLIEDADAFQLFWSHNSMHSKFVRQEYEHALSLGRPSFVRPTYWEDPMPTGPGQPPDNLAKLHFQKLGGLFTPTPVGASAEGPRPVGAQIQVPAPPPPAASPGLCTRCGKENQAHYKFCLGCGADLAPLPAPSGAMGGMGMMKTMMADPAGLPKIEPPAMPAPMARPQAMPAPGPKGGERRKEAIAQPEIAESLTDVDQEFPSEPSPVTPPAGPVVPRTTTPAKIASAVLAPGSRAPTSPSPLRPASPSSPPTDAKPAAAKTVFAGSSTTDADLEKLRQLGRAGAAPYQPPASAPIGRPAGAMPPPGISGPMGGMPGAPPKLDGPPMMPPPLGPPPGVPGFNPGGAPLAASAMKRCPSCGSDVPPAFRFCGTCGFRMEEASAPMAAPVSPAVQPQVAQLFLTLINPDGSEGGRFDLAPGKNRLGRKAGALFESDGYMSPVHAELEITGSSATIRDLESLNGVFVKLEQEQELAPGAIFRIGQELLRYEPIEPRAPSVGETERLGSPNPGYWGKLTVLLDDEVSGAAYVLLGDAVTLGRSRGEINFGEDAYVSGLHARIERRDGKVYLADLGSANGTFVKVTERVVGTGAHVLLGQQLFRITLGSST